MLRAIAVVGLVGLVALSAPSATAGAAAPAAEQVRPLSDFGLRLAEDLAFKWRGVIPQIVPFEPGEATDHHPWTSAAGAASIPARAGHLRLGLGVGRLGLELDTNAVVEGSATRLRVRLRLDAGVGRLILNLPDVKMTPRFDNGQLTFDYLVPLIEHRF